MLLNSLARFAERSNLVEESSYQFAAVSWAVRLDLDGNYLELNSMKEKNERKKEVGKQMQIPRQFKRSVNLLSQFMVDKAEYALGLADEEGPKTPQRHGLFIEEIRKCAELTDSEEVKAMLKFLGSERDKALCKEELKQSGYISNDLICFQVDGDNAQNLPDVRRYWKSKMELPDGGVQAQCSMCGNIRTIIRLHPNIKPLSGASSSGVPIVSFNKDAFCSYGLEGNNNGPVCETCAIGYATAINRCLSDSYPNPQGGGALPKQSFRLSDNLTAIYWSDSSEGKVEKAVRELPINPELVKGMFETPFHRGSAANPGNFSCLLLQGAQGRATVRGYHTQTISEVFANLERWLAETETGLPKPLSLIQMLRSLAIKGEYGKLPPSLTEEIYLAILFGYRLPINVLQAAVSRNRVEARVSAERAALLQAWLSRRNPPERKLYVALNKECTIVPYRLGRALRICEQIQEDSAKPRKLNKTVVDRYFSALSTRPSAVFSSLMKLTEIHLSSLAKKNEGYWQRNRLAEILSGISPADFGSQFDLTGQAQFALGYYHQRWTSAKKEAAAENQGDEQNA